MADLKEQAKQKIAIELENARLWAAFLIPQVALFGSLFFTEQYFVNFPYLRYVLAFAVFIGIFLVILLRSEHIRRARKHIEEL